jgi:hypothetical protein
VGDVSRESNEVRGFAVGAETVAGAPTLFAPAIATGKA